ncbi:MAG: hypothetical protein Fur0046_20950 [Cyanobacteria bacterium J069]
MVLVKPAALWGQSATSGKVTEIKVAEIKVTEIKVTEGQGGVLGVPVIWVFYRIWRELSQVRHCSRLVYHCPMVYHCPSQAVSIRGLAFVKHVKQLFFALKGLHSRVRLVPC